MKFSVKSFLENELNQKLEENIDIFDGLSCVYELAIEGDSWRLDLSKNGSKKIEAGAAKKSDCCLEISAENFEKLAKGKLNIPLAVVTGKIKVKGSKGLALKLVELLK
jgi:putative sterol carrier protein